MINPTCTPGVVSQPGPDGLVTASCGCGWVQHGFPSRSAGKRAQKAHRFPPLELDDPGCDCGRDDRIDGHDFEPGCDAWTEDMVLELVNGRPVEDVPVDAAWAI